LLLLLLLLSSSSILSLLHCLFVCLFVFCSRFCINMYFLQCLPAIYLNSMLYCSTM
jgi:hypothetical protein